MLQIEDAGVRVLESVVKIGSIIVGGVVALWALINKRVRSAVRQQRDQSAADLMRECEARETGDEQLRVRMEDLSKDLQNYIGKLDLLAERMHKTELEAVVQLAELRGEVRQGFVRLDAMLDRIFNGLRRETR